MRRFTHIGKGSLVVLTAVVLVCIPLIADAVPGSGDFTALYSPGGRDITELWNLIGKICLGVLILVEGLLVISIIKFRRKSDDERPKQSHGYLPLEIGWTLAAAAIQVFIGVKTIDTMFKVEEMPEQIDMTVEAIAFQWGWQFRYPDQGGMITDDLVFPAHKNVKLEVTSRDVLHAIFIPELGVKIDAVPGRFNYFWFRADGPVNQVLPEDQRRIERSTEHRPQTRPDFARSFYAFFEDPAPEKVTGLESRVGYLADSRDVEDVSPYAGYNAVEYRGMCAELCGKGHYDMYFRAVAMTETSFQQWVEDAQSGGGEVDGGAIYSSKCSSCHAQDGAGVPPQFPPLSGTKWTNEEGMKDDHIAVVLQGSQAESLAGDTMVKGTSYSGVMQAWNEVLNDEEVAAVVNHERTSWGNSGGEVTSDDVARMREQLGLPPFPAGGAEPVPESELKSEGKELYAACAGCHGDDGEGLSAVPNLKGNPSVLADPQNLVGVLVNGQDTPKWPGAQPRMGASMTSRQLAAILTYVRTSWGNDGSAVQPEEVSRLRKELKKQ